MRRPLTPRQTMKLDIHDLIFRIVHIFLLTIAVSSILDKLDLHGANVPKDFVGGVLAVVLSEVFFRHSKRSKENK
jgi:hypothetical protein